jgi:signal transduction histidine kinase/ActR/RegA family two-component response regulator
MLGYTVVWSHDEALNEWDNSKDPSEITHLGLEALRDSSRPATPPQVRLIALAGPIAGRKLTLGDSLILGRSSTADLSIDDPLLSRRHAKLSLGADGHYLLEDLGSRNGTSLNGMPCTRDSLSFGDRVQVGSSILLFTHYDPLEEQVAQRQKLEAIGRLGTGIAHDFNNLLGAILSSMDFVEELPPNTPLSQEDVAESLRDVRIAAMRAAEMTRRLLGFARQTHRSHGPVDLRGLVEEVIHLARRTFDRSIEIDANLDGTPVISGDHSQLHQLLMNLFINARDAMPNGGKISVVGRRATEAEMAMAHRPTGVAHALIRVQDTGTGMDTDVQKHAFEPFFTTKDGEAGAGLGLATVYEVAAAHGGHVDLWSKRGEGTAFTVFLPLGQTKRPISRPATLEGAAPIKLLDTPMRILLVDDEDVVRRSAGRVLRQAGHEVVYARDGEEAVQLYAEAQRKPDLVLLDLNMPITGGEETFHRLRRVDPQAPVLFVSGYWDRELERRLRSEGALGFVQKPYEVRQLKEALHAAIIEKSVSG